MAVELDTLGAIIKLAYEAQTNTNAFTDDEQTKLASVESSATANPNALDNLVEDTTPQLGGDLDVNGNSITSASNADVEITPHGTGAVVLKGLRFPTTDGTAGQIIKTDGSGQLSFATESGSGGGSSDADLLFTYVFEASDRSGGSNVASELVTILNTAAGAPVYIPEGTYLINSPSGLAVTTSVHLVLSPKAVIKYNYAADNRCLWFRNESTAAGTGSGVDIVALDNVTYFHSEKVTRVSLASVSGFSKYDVVHIHSQDGWLESQADDRRIGQCGTVAYVDSVNNYLYLYQRLELESLLTTSPRIRKMTTRYVIIEGLGTGAKFEANGDHDDPTQGVQANRRAAIEIFGTPYVRIRNIKFNNLWAQGIALVGSPFSIVENCEFNGLVNLMCAGGSSGTTASINITGINTGTGVVTLADASTLSNNHFIYVSGIVGTTQLNGRVYRVTNKSGNTIQLVDYFADGESSAMSMSGFGAYVSGGTVSRADVNALGYGIQYYGASCWSIARNNTARGCRHFVTSDGVQDDTYSDNSWFEYGLPTNITIESNVSLYSDGIPFDEHEEAINWIWKGNVARNSSRGPDFQDSYYGVGFQARGINSTWIDNIADGGAWGMRISMSDAPLPSTITIRNFTAQNLLSKDSEGSYGIRVIQETSDPPEEVKILIDGLMVKGANTGIQTESGSDVKITATNVRFHDVDECIDLAAGTEFVALDRVTADFRGTQFASGHYFCRLRSHATQGSSKCILLGGLTLVGETGHMPAEVFYQSDTTATKYYYMPTNGLVQYHGGASAATLLSAGETTLDEETGITVS